MLCASFDRLSELLSNRDHWPASLENDLLELMNDLLEFFTMTCQEFSEFRTLIYTLLELKKQMCRVNWNKQYIQRIDFEGSYFEIPEATACNKIMVHGNGWIDQGVYILRPQKVNGLVSYISPKPNEAYLLKGTSSYWVIERISSNEILGMFQFWYMVWPLTRLKCSIHVCILAGFWSEDFVLDAIDKIRYVVKHEISHKNIRQYSFVVSKSD